jgi:transcriptional regulator with XRE-family HTH domain
VDRRSEVHDFLFSRRARLTPAQAWLPVFDDKRRVAGLRREEVASLAGVSVDYYARLERGNLRGVSDTVLEALVRALHSTMPNASTCSTSPTPATQPPQPGHEPQRRCTRLLPFQC